MYKLPGFLAYLTALPWAANFGLLARRFDYFALIEMAVFIAILLVGWLYAWRKGALQWS